jgi:creatinine amidohydrolase
MCAAHASTTPGAWVEDLNWPQIEQRLQQGAVAVLPVGAGSKAHGPHLPMNCDYLQARYLCQQLLDRHRVLVWPVLSYGHYPAFASYPGSISLSAPTFTRQVTEILQQLAHLQPLAIMIVNTGISTIAPLQQLVKTLSLPCPLRLANVYRGTKLRAAIERVQQQGHGGHADEIETSLMLVMAPERVDMDLARAAIAEANDRRPDLVHASGGILGDPTLANRDKGGVLLAAINEDLSETLQQLQAAS